MTLTEMPAGLHLPKTALPCGDEVIEQINHHGNKLAVVYRGHRNVPARKSTTTWAKKLIRKSYMRIVTYEARFDEDGNFSRWMTVSRNTVDL